MVALPFGRLSNRALAANGGKCRCGPLGRGNYKIPDIRIGAGFYPARGWSATPTFLYLVGAGVPDGPLLVLSPKGYFALRRDSLLPTAAKGCKNAAKNQWFWNSFRPIAVAVQKGSAANRLCAYPRCR